MTIIKHGSPKERLHFGCPECGCEWRATLGETEKTCLGYQMRCPDCGVKVFIEEVILMTLSELKSLQKRIERLKSKRARLRSEAQKVTPSLSGMPPSDNGSDKVGTAVAQIADIDADIDALTAEYQVHINRLSREQFVENCIYLYLTHRDYTWRRIAFEVTGREDTFESIKKNCYRYQW